VRTRCAAATGNDTLYGDDGADLLYGDAGADTFVFEDAHGFDNDQVADFNAGAGDKLDISDILDLYDYGVDDLLDFVKIEDSGSDSLAKIDADGGGDSFVTVATLLGVRPDRRGCAGDFRRSRAPLTVRGGYRTTRRSTSLRR
jgi:Ca2+-binding RTX toxin-like protein